jgi:hypothetical protein
MGLGLDIGYIDHCNIQLVIALNYNSLALLRTPNITVVFFPCLGVRLIPPSKFIQ